ncbi:glycoside hydrolase family 13 protein [Wenyingzhuangia marina]|uniref:Glycosidase n=1 Tax=Wenyingzhuangia marina TaxID=1195760 RepID=A0A1M5T8S7_9FLAO|nr:glycoside hydrolase family 13 protein [Wenyingzhuangia marina]SHH47114.1 Glycosidase [Wenyingzhuangia marina]
MKKQLYLFAFLFCYLGANAQIQHLEPSFWWEGMKYHQVQIMVHGKNIANLSVSAKNIEILEVTKTQNPNYLFVTLETQNLTSGTYPITFKKNKKVVQHYNFEIKTRRINSSQRKGFDSSDAIYLIMPDRFSNGNPDNDSMKSVTEKADRKNKDGRHGGDIQGIINHVDYLKDLGITTLWSTPLLEDNEPVTTYHTYAQSDLYKIDPRFGTNKEYLSLSKELHKKDMKLVMDYVTNHWSSKHWMIQDLPTPDWIHVWADGDKGFKRSNYRMTSQFDTNASNIDSKECMDGWFDSSMPDINQQNPLVLNYLIQNAIWWIEYANLDGLRVDTYSYNDKDGIAKWTKTIMGEYPNFNIVGEVWMQSQAQISFWQKDSKIGKIKNYNSYLPSVMDFTLHNAITQMFNEDNQDWNTGMMRAYENFANDFLYPNIDNILVFAANHDTNRINEILDGDVNKYKLAITLISTIRGIPQLYYGDEIGMRGDKNKHGDGDIRRDFPGGWKNDSQNAFLQNGRTPKQNEYHNFTKKLLQWRKNTPVIHTGKTKHFLPINNVYTYFRYDDTKKVMVVINNSNQTQTVNCNRFKEILSGYSSGVDFISNQKINLETSFSIKAKTSYVIEL